MHIHVDVELRAPRAIRAVRGRRRLLAGALAVALAVPSAALASHGFADVPSTHQFHTAIDRVSDAAITGGCGGGNYCPNANVTRGQMAAFLARTGGRAAYGYDFALVTSSDPTDVVTVTITAGSATGGTAFVVVNSSWSASTASAAGCPCGAEFYITADAGDLSTSSYAQVDAVTSQGFGVDSGSNTAVFTVPTGVPQTFRLKAERFGGTGALDASGALTAQYLPFSGTGTDTLVISGWPSKVAVTGESAERPRP